MNDKKRLSRGRPKSNDPKIHLPNVTVNTSTIATMQYISEIETETGLSGHYQKALDNYINNFHKTETTKLGYPK